MYAAPAPPREQLQLVGDLVYQSIEFLDESLWSEWLSLCDDDFVYKIVAYSPEIRKDMMWLEHGLEGMLNLVDLLPKHQSDRSRLTRHVSLYRVARRDDGLFDALSSVVVYRTALDGGTTTLFALGKYFDVVRVENGRARFVARTLRLETRDLGLGTHFPL
jgi:methanesulfonate monooxygenase small subunit